MSRAEGYIPSEPARLPAGPVAQPAQQRPPYVLTLSEREALGAQRGPQ